MVEHAALASHVADIDRCGAPQPSHVRLSGQQCLVSAKASVSNASKVVLRPSAASEAVCIPSASHSPNESKENRIF